MLTKTEIEMFAAELIHGAIERIDFDHISSYAIEEDWSDDDVSAVLNAAYRAKVTIKFD